MKILMVCLGNICRSPLAEGILKHKVREAGLNWIIDSAGTNGYHNGEPPHRLSQKVARQHSINISSQRSRRITGHDFYQYDIIYAMAPDVMEDMKRITGKDYNEKKVRLLMDEIVPGKNAAVPDPWSGPEPGYQEVFKLIEKACEAIIQKMKNEEFQIKN